MGEANQFPDKYLSVRSRDVHISWHLVCQDQREPGTPATLLIVVLFNCVVIVLWIQLFSLNYIHCTEYKKDIDILSKILK